MDTMDEIRETFFLECEDLLQDLETGLTAIRDGDRDPEKVNSVFRAVHSIKGGAGAFALNDLVRFAHKFETTLDEVRAGRLEPQTDLIALFLRSADFLADLVASAQSGDQVDGEQIDHLISELESFIDSDGAAPSAENFVFEPIALDFSLDFDAPPPPPAEDGDWRITLSPHENLFARGNDSVLLLRALRLLGDYSVTCFAVKTMARIAETVPDTAGPPAQACERLGLPRSFLWKSEAERARLLESARNRPLPQEASA